MPVSAFYPWDSDEVEELNLQNARYTSATAPNVWRVVADLSTRAVEHQVEGWTFEAWNDDGRAAGLRCDPLDWFDSLLLWPIQITADHWVSGRHRSLLIQRAGVLHLAALDPDWVPEW